MTGIECRRAEMRMLREQILTSCQDVRDGVMAGWCAAAMRLYAREGLMLMAEMAAERGDWAEHRRLIARLMAVAQEGTTSE